MGAHQPVEESRLLDLLKRAAGELGATAWVVGGYVRDKLLGRSHLDLDVVVEDGDSLAVARRFAALAGASPPVTFERFGTAQVTLPGRLVEFVTARVESYAPDSRKPDVRQATLDEDLRRRDFTVNTLLMDLDGNVHDRLGARHDLEGRVLRTPTDPEKTFTDDPLRMLRGIRFAAELGFELAPDLLPAMRRLRSRLAPPVISAERIAEELRKMLVSPRPRRAFELLDEADLLAVILPEVAACKGVAQTGYHTHDVFGHTLLAVEATPPDLLTRLGAARAAGPAPPEPGGGRRGVTGAGAAEQGARGERANTGLGAWATGGPQPPKARGLSDQLPAHKTQARKYRTLAATPNPLAQ